MVLMNISEISLMIFHLINIVSPLKMLVKSVCVDAQVDTVSFCVIFFSECCVFAKST